MLDMDLQKLGMEGREARVYLATLKLKKAKVTEIARESGYDRSYCYAILNKLEKGGLVRKYDPKGGIIYYLPENPEKLAAVARDRLSTTKELIPKLIELSAVKEDEPKIDYYRGEEGVAEIYKRLTFAQEKELFGIVNIDLAIEKLGGAFKRSLEKCFENRTKICDLVVKGKESKGYIRDKRISVRVLPRDTSFKSDFIVFGNKVAQISLAEPIYGYIIESVNFAEAWREIHKVLWAMSEKVKSRK
jgi:sugar-specific transcriptional regulator TrmB